MGQDGSDPRGGRRDGRPSRLYRYGDRQPDAATAALFHGLMLSQGGRLRGENLPDDAADCLEDLRWRGDLLLKKVQFPEIGSCNRIAFDFTSRPRLDGYCRVFEDVGAIGLSYGLIQRIYEASHALMCVPGICGGYGKTRDLSADERRMIALQVFPAEGGTVGKAPRVGGYDDPPSAAFAAIVSEDIDRRWAAHGMAGMIFQFILYHEWMHLISGHFHQGRPIAGGGAFLHELEQRNVADPQLAQAIEFSADRRAAWRIADELRSDQMLLVALTQGTLSFAQRMEGWNLLLCTLILRVSMRPDHAVRGRLSDHPHPAVRFWTVFARLHQDLKAKDASLEQAYLDSVRQTFLLLRRLWSDAGHAGDPFAFWIGEVNQIMDEVNRLGQEEASMLLPRLCDHDALQRISRKSL